MNVYEKLATARVKFQALKVAKSGRSDSDEFGYYELSDILPAVNKITLKLKLICLATFTKDEGKLCVINAEASDEVIVFTLPMAGARIPGCHPVQNLGAIQTYLKRYLYQNAFEIVEPDLVDKRTPPKARATRSAPDIQPDPHKQGGSGASPEPLQPPAPRPEPADEEAPCEAGSLPHYDASDSAPMEDPALTQHGAEIAKELEAIGKIVAAVNGMGRPFVPEGEKSSIKAALSKIPRTPGGLVQIRELRRVWDLVLEQRQRDDDVENGTPPPEDMSEPPGPELDIF